MSRFHVIPVSAVKNETADSVSVAFAVPAELAENFRYKPGQYLTLRLSVNGETINRSYSFCSAPIANEPHTIAVKKVTDGRASNFINSQLKVGDKIEIMEPMGNFFVDLNSNHQKHYLLFAGGSGITPVFSILKSVLIVEPNSRITLFYGNRDEASIIFHNELKNLLAANPSRLKIVHILNDAANPLANYSGLFDRQLVVRMLQEQTDSRFEQAEVFICGPTPMMKETEAALQLLNISKDNIHIEYFTEKSDEDKVAAEIGGSIKDAPPFAGNTMVKIIYDGREAEFEVNEKEHILSAALDAGYDPPYSCMVAACCTCRAKLMSGNVIMDDRESLSDAEIEKGYVLTCQARPKSHGIVLNFDI